MPVKILNQFSGAPEQRIGEYDKLALCTMVNGAETTFKTLNLTFHIVANTWRASKILSTRLANKAGIVPPG
jgi:hypothetical protein